MFKARDGRLPLHIQKHFVKRDGHYNLRGTEKFKQAEEKSTRKSFCLSVYGVKIWNDLSDELRGCPNIRTFKKNYNELIVLKYVEEENSKYL